MFHINKKAYPLMKKNRKFLNIAFSFFIFFSLLSVPFFFFSKEVKAVSNVWDPTGTKHPTSQECYAMYSSANGKTILQDYCNGCAAQPRCLWNFDNANGYDLGDGTAFSCKAERPWKNQKGIYTCTTNASDCLPGSKKNTGIYGYDDCPSRRTCCIHQTIGPSSDTCTQSGGSCQSGACTTGTHSGTCSNTAQKCCNKSGPPPPATYTCTDAQHNGVCQANACSNGIVPGGTCAGSQNCCNPVGTTCSGVCLSTCSSGGTSTGTCSGSLKCCKAGTTDDSPFTEPPSPFPGDPNTHPTIPTTPTPIPPTVPPETKGTVPTAPTDATVFSGAMGVLENLPGFEAATQNVKDFPTFIKSFYILAMWIVGISALFMGTFGAFVYLTSAGNTSRAGKGKEIIIDAIIGLVILLFTWLILNTINPDLVNLHFSSVNSVPNDSESGAATPNTTGTVGNCGGMLTTGVGDQCKLVAPELNALMSCMAKGSDTGPVNSITSQWVGGDLEKSKSCCGRGGSTQTDKDQCPHAANTCHDGCPNSHYNPPASAIGYSQAVDYTTAAEASNDDLCAIAEAAWLCGAGKNIWGPKTIQCSSGVITYQEGHKTHLHIPTSQCNG